MIRRCSWPGFALALTTALAAQAPLVPGTPQQTASARIAFRVDDTRLIAHLQLLDDLLPQLRVGSQVIARFGYSPFAEPPASWIAHMPALPAKRWIVHAGARRTFEAVAERVVAGNAACSPAAGVLLTVLPKDAPALAAIKQRYFVVEPATSEAAVRTAGRSSVGVLPDSTATPDLRRKLEQVLDNLLQRELPDVQKDAAPELARMSSSDVGYHRSWARERQFVEKGLSAGRARLFYDLQPFRLSPDGVPYYFVRAMWRVDGRLAFAVSLWLRGDDLTVVWRSLRPAAWLRMSEFQGRISTEHLGFVLNVIDREGDGWAEVLFGWGGYESRSVEEWRLSTFGFEPTGVSYAYGC